MCKKLLLSLAFAALLLGLTAQTKSAEPIAHDLTARIEAVSDSLLKMREAEVRAQYGFSDADKLEDVAQLLNIKNVDLWKSYLKLEPANKALDKISLRNLGITPYKALLAQQYSIHHFTELSTLSEIAAQKNMPIKKLRSMADINSLDDKKDSYSLQALELKPAQVDSMAQDFADSTIPFGISVTIVGMLIVFSALLVTSIIVSLLVHTNPKPKIENRPLVIDRSGKLISKHELDPNVIAAALTALHLFQSEVQERKKQLLTFKRTPTNQWRASQVMNMPNLEILRTRRIK